MPEENLLTNLSNGVFTITLNRPKTNAFDTALIKACTAAFKQAGRDKNIRTVLLTGSGNIFSAGQDLTEVTKVENLSFREHLLETYNPLILEIRRLEKPVLAAINGPVAGAALGVALACDLRIASEKSVFMVGFNGIGLAPDSAVSLLLPALIGLGRAAEATYFNKAITAEQALAWGMVNQLSPAETLLEDAQSWANRLAAGPILTYGLTKKAFNHAIFPNLEDVLDYEADLQEIAGKGTEHKEGLSAFFEKRVPNYKTL